MLIEVLFIHREKNIDTSYRKQVSDENALNIVKLNYLLVKNEIFRDKKPNIIFLPNFGSLFHNVLYHYAKVNNVECWIPTASKISNRIILTNSIDYCSTIYLKILRITFLVQMQLNFQKII